MITSQTHTDALAAIGVCTQHVFRWSIYLPVNAESAQAQDGDSHRRFLDEWKQLTDVHTKRPVFGYKLQKRRRRIRRRGSRRVKFFQREEDRTCRASKSDLFDSHMVLIYSQPLLKHTISTHTSAPSYCFRSALWLQHLKKSCQQIWSDVLRDYHQESVTLSVSIPGAMRFQLSQHQYNTCCFSLTFNVFLCILSSRCVFDYRLLLSQMFWTLGIWITQMIALFGRGEVQQSSLFCYRIWKTRELHILFLVFPSSWVSGLEEALFWIFLWLAHETSLANNNIVILKNPRLESHIISASLNDSVWCEWSLGYTGDWALTVCSWKMRWKKSQRKTCVSNCVLKVWNRAKQIDSSWNDFN